MTIKNTFRWRHLAGLLVALACAAGWSAGQVRSMRGRSEVAEMTQKMKTICVGRYLVDVPALADVNLSAEALLARLRLRGADEIADVPGFCNADELLRIAKLRSHKRSINGLDGDEVVGRVREYNRATDYAFDWETRGATDDAPRPDLLLEMQTGVNDRPGGKRVDTDLHEDALPVRWDSIASSIRLRTNELPAAPPE